MHRYWQMATVVAATMAVLAGQAAMAGQPAPDTAPTADSTSAEPARVVVRPADTGAALDNPGMGWVFHFYDNVPQNYGSRLAPSDTVNEFPGLAVVYLRIPWSYVEPEEGRFNWAVVDTPAQRWIARGKRVAFRFSCSESWTRWATPEWVSKAGAKGYDFKVGAGVVAGGPFWEPDYDDPVFLEKLDRFLAAAAARYDGNPEVDFVDVGSFGVWGEGHTFASTRLPYTAATVQRHIDLYRKHFKRTLLAANDDFVDQGRGREVAAYARQQGLTLRDDSILVQAGKNAYFHAALAPDFWPSVPVILESEHFGGSRDRGNWKDGALYLQAVEDYHASYASIHWWPREFLAENRDLIQRMNQRMGYRLQLAEASWPPQVRVGGTLPVRTLWRNAGVAPCLPGGRPAITLKDAKGGLVGVFVDEAFDVLALPVAAPGKAEARPQEAAFLLPFNLTAGTYDVFVSVGTRTGTPRIALPLAGDDGQRRYRLGTIRVTADYAVRPGTLDRRGDQWRLPLEWTTHGPLPAGVTAFAHFGKDGGIAFQGYGEPGQEAGRFQKAGTTALACVFTAPETARGRTFDVRVGLWRPDRLGKPDERLIPDSGETDRRVTIGTVAVDAAGNVVFTPARPE